MTDQLFQPPAPVTSMRKLTDRQQRAWDLIRTTHGGVTADEIGAHVHGHADDAPRCEWCATAGREVARSVALRPLVIYRRSTGKYEPRREEDRAPEPAPIPGVQLRELAGDTWEDLFGDAA